MYLYHDRRIFEQVRIYPIDYHELLSSISKYSPRDPATGDVAASGVLPGDSAPKRSPTITSASVRSTLDSLHFATQS